MDAYLASQEDLIKDNKQMNEEEELLNENGSLIVEFHSNDVSEDERFSSGHEQDEVEDALVSDLQNIFLDGVELNEDRNKEESKVMEIEYEKVDNIEEKEESNETKPNKEINKRSKKVKNKPKDPKIVWQKISHGNDYSRLILAEIEENYGPKEELADSTPKQLFSLFITDELLEKIVEQTNLYATQCRFNNEEFFASHPKSRFSEWKNVDRRELEVFLGLYLLTSIHTLKHYNGKCFNLYCLSQRLFIGQKILC